VLLFPLGFEIQEIPGILDAQTYTIQAL